jgi:hypothetical protein
MIDRSNGSDLLALRGKEPRFQLGGPVYRLVQRVGLINDDGAYVVRRIVAFVIIAWLPLLVLSTLRGNALGPTPREAFLFDFVSYARFFVAVPLTFAAELVVGPRLRAAGLRFFTSGIIRPEDRPRFDAAVASVSRRREAIAPESILCVISFAGPWFLSLDALTGVQTSTWSATLVDAHIHLTPVGVWYYFVAVPIVQFLIWRRLWRLAIWSMFLWDMSRLKLNLLATHADRAGGLGFLGRSHVSLSIFPFALGCVLSSEVAFRVVFEGLDFKALKSLLPYRPPNLCEFDIRMS